MKTTVRMTESAVMLAAAFALSLINLMPMPFGGSITPCSMLPVLLVAYRHGTKWGLFVGFVGALLQLLTGLQNLSWATSMTAAIAIVMLDYVAAFTALGLGGIFRRSRVPQVLSLVGGAAVACAVRFVCHVIAGCTVWAGVSIPDSQGLIYSLAYNAAYMVPETVLTLAACAAIGSTVSLTADRLRPVENVRTHATAVVGGLVGIVGVAVAAIWFFAAVQTEDGYALSAVASTDWLVVGVSLAVALVGGIVAFKK